MLELTVQGNPIRQLKFEVGRMLNGVLTNRNQEELRRHLEEGKKHGLTPPKEIPNFLPKIADRLTTTDRIQVLPGNTSSGEAEFVLLIDKEAIYIGVGSDHSERKVEKASLTGSKQIYPNVMSKDIWAYTDIKNHWDNIILRSWVSKDGQKNLYQDARLAAIMTPEELVERIKLRVEGDLTGMVLFSGTVAGVNKELQFGNRFETHLIDEKMNRRLICAYNIESMDWFKGDMP